MGSSRLPRWRHRRMGSSPSRRSRRDPEGRRVLRSPHRRPVRRSRGRSPSHRVVGAVLHADSPSTGACGLGQHRGTARLPAVGHLCLRLRTARARARQSARGLAGRRRTRSRSHQRLLPHARCRLGQLPRRVRHGRYGSRSVEGFRSRSTRPAGDRQLPCSVPRTCLRARGHRPHSDRTADGDPGSRVGLHPHPHEVERAGGVP